MDDHTGETEEIPTPQQPNWYDNLREQYDMPEVAPAPEPEDRETETFSEMLTRSFKNAIIESRDLLVDIIAAAIQRSQSIDEHEMEPEIPYRYRHAWLKVGLGLGVIGLLTLGISIVYVALSGNPLVSAICSLVLIVLLFGSFGLIKRIGFAGTRTPRFMKMISMGWKIGVVVLSLIFWAVLTFAQVHPGLTLGYLVLNGAALYFASLVYFLWYELWIVRSGNTLSAKRPASKIFFLGPVDRNIQLNQVTNNDLITNWFEKNWLKIDRAMINVADDKDGYWNNLGFLDHGEQLMAAVDQGRGQ